MNRTLVATVLVLLAVGSALPVPAQTPPDIRDGWRRSTPEDQGLDPGVVQQILDQFRTRDVFETARGIVIVRHGVLVAEDYRGGFTNTTLKNVHSVSKSVTSLATGIALDRGLIPSVDTRLAELIPHYAHRLQDAHRSRLTLRHALNMTAGMAWSDSDPEFWNNVDSVDFVLTRAIVAEPGEEYAYSSGLSHVIAEANNHASGESHLAFIQRRLFNPMGITTATWDTDLSGRHWGGTGLRIRPRDMAKIGQLALQGGLWQGRRLVSREWVAESTSGQTVGIAGAPSYGYQWWIRPLGRYLAHGYNGQYVGVDPEADIVMTMITLSEQSPRPQETYRLYFEQLQDLARTGIRTGDEAEQRGRFTAVRAAGEPGANHLAIRVERRDGSDGGAALAYRTVNATARAGRDYDRIAGELRWEHGDDSPRTLQVSLVAHGDSRVTTEFELEFESMSGDMEAPPRMRLGIAPGGRAPGLAGAVEFTAEAFVGREGETAIVTVERRGGSDGAIEVGYATALHSAGENDFDPASGRLTWNDGEAGAREIRLPLAMDGEVERTELVDIVLHDAAGGPDLNETRAVVAIRDMTGGSGCTAGPQALCLNDDRFRVEVEWEAPNGNQGSGQVTQLSDESGIATFFSPDNVELVLKVLDGRGLNDHHWVFFGALTDVEYWLTVTDTLHDRVVVYRNPPGEVCGRGDTSAFLELAAAASSTAWAPGMAAPATLAAAPTGSTLAGPADAVRAGSVFVFADDSASTGPTAVAAARADTEATAEDCPANALCLQGGRFRVTASWATRDGREGQGAPLPGGDTTGYMSFFSPGNIELAVKVLDGRRHNGAFWVFASGITDVDYLLTVTDAATGDTRTWTNPNRPFCGLNATSAFPQDR